MTTVHATNQQIADELGITHSGVSRIRSGDRVPSIDLMEKIAKQFEWDVLAQVKARREGSYAAQFEQRLIARFGAPV